MILCVSHAPTASTSTEHTRHTSITTQTLDGCTAHTNALPRSNSTCALDIHHTPPQPVPAACGFSYGNSHRVQENRTPQTHPITCKHVGMHALSMQNALHTHAPAQPPPPPPLLLQSAAAGTGPVQRLAPRQAAAGTAGTAQPSHQTWRLRHAKISRTTGTALNVGCRRQKGDRRARNRPAGVLRVTSISMPHATTGTLHPPRHLCSGFPVRCAPPPTSNMLQMDS